MARHRDGTLRGLTGTSGGRTAPVYETASLALAHGANQAPSPSFAVVAPRSSCLSVCSDRLTCLTRAGQGEARRGLILGMGTIKYPGPHRSGVSRQALNFLAQSF